MKLRPLDQWRNTVSASEAARIAGARYGEFMEVAGSLGFQTLNGRLEHHEVRKVLYRLVVRTSDPERLARLRAAIQTFVDESERVRR